MEYDDERSGGLEPLKYLPKGNKRVFPGFITTKKGGAGILVEVVQYVLKSKGIYDDVFNKMRKEIYEV